MYFINNLKYSPKCRVKDDDEHPRILVEFYLESPFGKSDVDNIFSP